MRTTINDVARVSGVAISTVSMALRDSNRISQETRTRVKAIAKELNFIPNHMARALASNKYYTIGVLTEDIENPFYSRVFAGIQEVTLNREYSTIIYPKNVFIEKKIVSIERLLRRGIDGLILFPGPIEVEDIEYIIETKIPFVLFNDHMLEDQTDYVVCNNTVGGYDITKHLIEVGHKRIAYVGPTVTNRIGNERLAGYRKALLENNIPVKEEMIFQYFFQKKFNQFISAFLGMKEKPTAIFAFNDRLAIMIINSLRENGIKVPEDIAVVGFDNIEWSEYSNPPLTTIDHPGYDMGRKTAELLLDKIEDKVKDIQHIVVTPKLVVRKSCGIELRKGR